MTFSARRLAAAILAAGALWPLISGAGAAATAVRARNAFVSSCDRIPPAATNGVWVRLQGCGVSHEFEGFLDDNKGQHLRRLMPVWRIDRETRRAFQPGEPVLTSPLPPSQIAVAIPIPAAGDQPSLQLVPDRKLYSDGLSSLVETMGVIIGRTGDYRYRVAEVPGMDRAMARGTVIIDVVAPPAFKDAGVRVLLGLMVIGLAWAVDKYQPPAVLTRGAPLNWSRILVFTLIGVVALWRGTQWYFDPLRQMVNTPVSAVSPTVSATPAPPGAKLREATREELALLESADTSDQLKGAELVNERALTVDLQSAVERALTRQPSQAVQEKLIEALVKCSDQAPERIRDALMPAIHTSNDAARRKVLGAFRSMNLPRIPPKLLAEAGAKGPFQREAFDAALALGALRLNPELVIANSRNATTSAQVRQELRVNTEAASARILARIWVDGADYEFGRLANEREKASHDISAALLEIVLDDKQPETRRTQAAYRLGTLAEVGALAPLRTLATALGPGVLKQSVDHTADQLDALRRQGRTAQMRALF